jgi:TonB-dependent receptor
MKLIKFFILDLLFLISFNSFSQNGTIRVNVYDKENGEPLIGATARIEGTSQGGVSDLEGKASISGLSAGTYDIEVSYISYQKQLIKKVTLSAGETKILDIRMASEDLTLEEIVVSANMIEDNENALLTVQKKSPKFMDAVSSDMFSRAGDNDAASAVKRVVGVTVEGGKYVYVRGLGDRYSKTILNGADIPGLDPNKNSVQLDLFPSNLIDNIIVYKSFTPDLMGDFSGGLVDVTTKNFPDRFTLQFSGSTGYNTQASFNQDFLSYQGSKTDKFGFDDGLRDIPALIKDVPDEFFPSSSRLGLPGSDGTPISQEDITTASRSFTNRQFDPVTSSASLDYNFSISVGNQLNIGRMPYGVIFGLTYAKTNDFYDNGRVNRFSGLVSEQPNLNGDVLFSLNDSKSLQEVIMGGILNNSFKLNHNNKIGLNLMYNQGGIKETRLLQGLRLDNVPDSTNLYESRVLSWTERSIANAQLNGTHVIPGINNFTIDWLISYTKSTSKEPDLRFLANNIIVRGPEDFEYLVSNQNKPGRYYRDLEEDNWDNRINFTLPIKLFNGLESKFKFGGAFTRKERIFREKRYIYTVRPTRYAGNIQEIFTDENLGYDAEGSLRSDLDVLNVAPNNYDAELNIYAGYLSMDARISQKLRSELGVRYEQTEQNLISFDPNSNGNLNTQDFLPAFNLTYEMAKNTNLRFSYGRTLARPSFREFAPLRTFAFYGESDQLGDPNLKRTIIDNLDLRWEKFPRAGEYMGVSIFYKRLLNPIENTIIVQSGGSTPTYIYNNVDEGTIIGTELEFRKNLDFITEVLKSFKIAVNFTYVYSKVSLSHGEYEARRSWDPDTKNYRDMFNQSPYVINASLIYENQDAGISTNLTFNVFGERLKFFSTNLPLVYEQPRPDLNFYFKKSLGDHWGLSFRMRNLLNPEYKQTMDYKGVAYIYNSYTTGRDFSLGISFRVE